MTVQNVVEIHGEAGITADATSTDTAQALIPTVIPEADPDGKILQSALITVETNDVRIAFNVDPTTTLGHSLIAGSSLRLTNPRSLTSMKFISASAGAHGVIQVTPEYSTF